MFNGGHTGHTNYVHHSGIMAWPNPLVLVSLVLNGGCPGSIILYSAQVWVEITINYSVIAIIV